MLLGAAVALLAVFGVGVVRRVVLRDRAQTSEAAAMTLQDAPPTTPPVPADTCVETSAELSPSADSSERIARIQPEPTATPRSPSVTGLVEHGELWRVPLHAGGAPAGTRHP